ncbi:MAG: hypothetical protein KGI71_06395 [Patescibacteria group bacterium]|nr:hypothetical protein [Patescibacteria group bacterium]
MSNLTSREGLTLRVDPQTGRAHVIPRVGLLAPPPTRGRVLPYRSKWEHTFATHLEALVIAKQITWWAYEQLTLKLAPGLRYTPDFVVQETTSRLLVYEVKGWSKNRREGMAKLKVAAALFPWAQFVLVEYRGGRMGCTPVNRAADATGMRETSPLSL